MDKGLSEPCPFALSGPLSASSVGALSAYLFGDLVGHVNTSSKPVLALAHRPQQLHDFSILGRRPSFEIVKFNLGLVSALSESCFGLVGAFWLHGGFWCFWWFSLLGGSPFFALSEAVSRTRLPLKWGRHLGQGLGQGVSAIKTLVGPCRCPALQVLPCRFCLFNRCVFY